LQSHASILKTLKNPSLGEVYQSVCYQQDLLLGIGKLRGNGLPDTGK
jgi:hypothetical protein